MISTTTQILCIRTDLLSVATEGAAVTIFTLIMIVSAGLGDYVFKRDVEARRTMMTVVNLGFRVSQPR